METSGSSALAMYEQPRLTLIPNEQTSNSASALAKLAAASGLCKTQKSADAFFVIMYGYELGIPAMTALRTIHIINNTPVCSGEALLAIIRRSGKVEIKITGSATEATVYMKRRDTGEDYKAHWTIERAATAGLSGKGVWKQYPQAFLQWRGVSECSKFLCSDITNGLYTMEEIAPDLNYDESGTVIEAQTITISKPEPEAPKTAKECLQDENCRKRFFELLEELGITNDAPYLEALKIKRYGEFDGTYDALCTRMRDLNEAFNMLTPDPEDDAEPVIEPDPVAEATVAIPAEQAAKTLGQDNKTPIGRTPEPDITDPAALDMLAGNVKPGKSPFETDSVGDAIKAEQEKKTGSAFARGLNTYQQTQEQERIDRANAEIDAQLDRAMERNP